MRASHAALAALLLIVFGLTGCNSPADPGAQRSATQAKDLQNRILTTQTDR